MALTKAQTGLHEGKIMKRLLNGTSSGLMRKLFAGSMASLYMGLALVPVAHASDTEVYARKGTVLKLSMERLLNHFK